MNRYLHVSSAVLHALRVLSHQQPLDNITIIPVKLSHSNLGHPISTGKALRGYTVCEMTLICKKREMGSVALLEP